MKISNTLITAMFIMLISYQFHQFWSSEALASQSQAQEQQSKPLSIHQFPELTSEMMAKFTQDIVSTGKNLSALLGPANEPLRGIGNFYNKIVDDLARVFVRHEEPSKK
jgi:hypothetical protein